MERYQEIRIEGQPYSYEVDLATPEENDGPEILYFGCYRDVGHYLRSKRRPYIRYEETAWGRELDGALLPRPSEYGRLYYSTRGGWSAIALQDFSIDQRPGSHSAFIVAEEMPVALLLKEAVLQWPEVFGRRGFPRISP